MDNGYVEGRIFSSNFILFYLAQVIHLEHLYQVGPQMRSGDLASGVTAQPQLNLPRKGRLSSLDKEQIRNSHEGI